MTVRSETRYQARLRHTDTVLTIYNDSANIAGIAIEGFDIAHTGAGATPLVVQVQDGKLRHVLTAVLQPQAIARVLQRQQVPGDWVITVFDGSGLRIARSRGAERLIGAPAGPDLQQLMQQGHSVLYRTPPTRWRGALEFLVVFAKA